MTIQSIQAEIEEFVTERDWSQFHTPKNLAMALSVEVAELVEHFQWLSAEESLSPPDMDGVRDELADVAVYLFRLSQVLEVDLAAAISQKMVKNREKYPADQVRGSAKKYSAYPTTD